MSQDQMPFDARPDEVLGAVLRAGLDGADAEQFVARLQAAVATAEREESWNVLARWARPRLVATGLAAAAVLWFMLAREIGPPTGPEGLPAQELLAGQPPSGEILLSAVLDGPR